jgi:hypothetical protein
LEYHVNDNTAPTVIGHFRKKSVEIDAIRFDGANHEAVRTFTYGYFEEVDPEDRGDDPEVVATVWNQRCGARIPIKVGTWIARDEHGYFPIKAERMDEYEEVGASETFTWGESVSTTDAGRTVYIPVNRGGDYSGDLLMSHAEAVALRDMLDDLVSETQQRAAGHE